MSTWQKILREEIFSHDFEISDDNDKYIVDGVRSSYKANLTASQEQTKEILDGAYKAGFKLAKRRFSSKTIYVLMKSYRNAHLIVQFSIQPNVLFVCEVTYGFSGEELYTTAKKSKYFSKVYESFDKTLPLDFMNVNIDKELLDDNTIIKISSEYNWEEYFDYVYSFMVIMLEKLNDDSEELFLEESAILEESEKEYNKFDSFIDEIKNYNSNIRVEFKNGVKEKTIYIDWSDDYNNQSDESKNTLNTIISEFIEDIKNEGASVDVHRVRSKINFIRTIFIKYI